MSSDQPHETGGSETETAIRVEPALFHGRLWVPAETLPQLVRHLAEAVGSGCHDPIEGEAWRTTLGEQADALDASLIAQLSSVVEGQRPQPPAGE